MRGDKTMADREGLQKPFEYAVNQCKNFVIFGVW